MKTNFQMKDFALRLVLLKDQKFLKLVCFLLSFVSDYDNVYKTKESTKTN